MDWITIITIILGSSVLGTIMSSMFSWYVQKHQRKRRNSYIALLLSHSFEKYAHKCLTEVSEDELYRSSGGHAGAELGLPPKLFDLPDENFQEFNIKILDSIFEFPQKVSFAIDEVGFISTVADDDEAHWTSRNNTIELANDAISLADKLRRKYNLPIRKLKFGRFDLREEVKKRLK